jgi:hypothetical protein
VRCSHRDGEVVAYRAQSGHYAQVGSSRFLCIVLLCAACSSAHSRTEGQSTRSRPPTSATIFKTVPLTPKSGLDPSEGDWPAAGACGTAQGAIGTVRLGRGDQVPQPRCLIIRRNQHLRVGNDADMTVTVRLGTHLKATLASGKSLLFRGSVGDYFAPGIHRLHFSRALAADIWVDPVCNSSGACRTPSN